MLPIGLYVVGEAPPEVAAQHGNYIDWFARLTSALGAHVEVIDGRGGPVVDPRAYAALVISGSAASLTAPEPWMDDALEVLERAQRGGTPVLGVCFGHQLIGVFAGARVVENPRGWEYATNVVELSERGRRDPLFAGLGPKLSANQAHRDEIAVDTIGGRLEVLAHSRQSPVQAVALGDSIRGVQFHPEFSGEVMASYLALRRDDLRADAERRGLPGNFDDLPCATSAEAELVFANFVGHFARKA